MRHTPVNLQDGTVCLPPQGWHRSWVLLPGSVAPDELAHRLLTSYDIVRAKLPGPIRRALVTGQES